MKKILSLILILFSISFIQAEEIYTDDSLMIEKERKEAKKNNLQNKEESNNFILNEENQIKIGLAYFVDFAPYDGKNVVNGVMPVADVIYNNFYIKSIEYRDLRIGYEFYEENGMKISLFGQMMSNGYKSSQLNEKFSELDDREPDTHLGLGILNGDGISNFKINFSLSKDIKNVSSGTYLKLNVSKIKEASPNFKYEPFVKVEYMEKKYTNYYYGITKEEASRSLSTEVTEYNPVDCFIPSVGLNFYFQLNPKLSLISENFISFLPYEISNSPLINSELIYKSGIMLMYNF